ncbi:MAG: PKD-like domain-containing protein, partial [Saprospiraceae bacterium]
MTSDAAGNIYVAATSESDLEGLDPNNGGIDMWIIKLNSTGDVVWQKNFGGAGDDVPTDILVGPDGSVYVTANSTSDDGDFDANYGMQDFWLFKLDAGNGNVVFSNNYGGPGNDLNAVMSNFGSQHLAISATSNSDSADLTGNKGFNDLWVLTTTLNGTITNQMNYGGSLNDLSGDFVVVDSVLYLLNTTLSSDKNVPANTFSQQDLWYLTLDASPDECSGQLKCIPDSVTTNEIFPPALDVLTCTGGCTAGLQAGPSFLQGLCGDFTESTAFFKLTTDTMADLLTLTVETNEFNSPRLALMRSNNCGPFTPVYCETGSNGFLLMPYLEIDPLITYIIAISDADGNVGDFDLCASSVDVEFCNVKDTLYVTNTSLGSPFSGPFRPGEEVRICYELQDWEKLDCNGFQGLIPTFGPAWDPENFDPFGMPLEIDTPLDPIAMGTWDWHKVGDVRYNVTNPISGYAGGQGMPAGWYFTNTDDAPPNDGPDQTTGDIFHCLTTTDDWKLCFTLQVEDDCEENLDATITMRSFSDGELGVNTSLACAYDKEQILPLEMVCCRNPELQVIQEVSVCSGDTLILYPESNILGPVTYSWVADPDIGIEGATSGTNLQSFYQILTNETNNILKVRYILSAQGVNCQADPIIFTVRVFPQPTSRITISGPNIVCSGTPVTLNFENVGTPPFAIEVFRDNQFFANVLSETF